MQSEIRFKRLLALVLGMCATSSLLVAESRVFFVSLPDAPGWQDLAMLAAIPASNKLNEGPGPVIALNASGEITREVEDYLRRLKPSGGYHLGPEDMQGQSVSVSPVELSCRSAEEAAVALAKAFWTESSGVIICRSDDYASALMASALAARFRVPLLYSGAEGPSELTLAALRRLQPREVIFVGKSPAGLAATALPDVVSILQWLKSRGLETPYLAVTNARDRGATRINKLSLVAPMFAAARDGMVVPVDGEFLWHEPFKGKPLKGRLPAGVRPGGKTPRFGTIDLPGGEMTYVLGFGEDEKDRLLWLDLNRDQAFDGDGEGPHKRTFETKIFGKPYTLNFDKGLGKSKDLTVTCDGAEQVIRKLDKIYEQTEVPHYLCLVGLPDAVPMKILHHRNASFSSDLPYADIDEDWFSEIAVARIIGENVSFATLHASRTLTYDQLLDSTWSGRAGQALWEHSMTKAFENVGLDASAYHSEDDLGWIKEPSGKDKGVRRKNIQPDSPLTTTAFIAHAEHSGAGALGNMYNHSSESLLAPAVVESAGCQTSNLDSAAPDKSVVTRLLRNGAVSFLGQTGNGIAQQQQQRNLFWDGLFGGMDLGSAHLRAQNSKAAVVIENGQDRRPGGDFHQLVIRSLFGDPAFKPWFPSKPRSQPAKVRIDGERVTVFAPEQWWITRIRVPPDWKLWTDKPFYKINGFGSYPVTSWNGREGYNTELTCVDVVFTTDRRIKSVEQLDDLAEPLGWNGKFAVDEHGDGTRSYYWRVQLVDFHQPTGKILDEVKRVDFQVTFEGS